MVNTSIFPPSPSPEPLYLFSFPPHHLSTVWPLLPLLLLDRHDYFYFTLNFALFFHLLLNSFFRSEVPGSGHTQEHIADTEWLRKSNPSRTLEPHCYDGGGNDPRNGQEPRKDYATTECVVMVLLLAISLWGSLIVKNDSSKKKRSSVNVSGGTNTCKQRA